MMWPQVANNFIAVMELPEGAGGDDDDDENDIEVDDTPAYSRFVLYSAATFPTICSLLACHPVSLSSLQHHSPPQQQQQNNFLSGASFNKLAHAVRADNDPFSDVQGDLRALFATRLAERARAAPGSIAPLVAQMAPEAAQAVQGYLAAAGQSLA